MVNDPISDMLIRIKNAQAVGHEQVSMPFSKVKFALANVLRAGGFISEVSRSKKKAKKAEHDYLDITLKYYYDGGAAINGFKIISRPSRHMYIQADKIKTVRSGYGMAVISTSKGIMSSKDAKKNRLGGEIMFEVY